MLNRPHRPPREVLKSIENKENLTDNSNKPPHSRQISYRLNKQLTDINYTTVCKIRTPSRGRQLYLPPQQENKQIVYPLTNTEEQEHKRYLSTKESQYQTLNHDLQPQPQKPLRLSQNIPRKRISGNFSAKDSTILNDNLMKLIPPTCEDKAYQMGPIIGKGSYAIVKMGTDRSGNKVAIKMYEKAHLKGERLNNLVKEISTIRMLNHEQVVKLYNVYHYASSINLVLEYCGTESLYSLLKTSSSRNMPKENAFNIIHQLLKILHHIHDRNICHRDIKLENILIQNKKIILIDFGFSTFSNQPITCHCGTPSYMAPEVVSKLKYDGRAADIWAVGVLLVTLLQGSFPFKGDCERELFKKIRNNESKIVNQEKDVHKLLSRIFVVDPYQRATAKEVRNYQLFQLLQLDVFKN